MAPDMLAHGVNAALDACEQKIAGMTEDQLVDRVYGNIHLEHPEITREQVLRRIRLRQTTSVARDEKR